MERLERNYRSKNCDGYPLLKIVKDQVFPSLDFTETLDQTNGGSTYI